jgi:L-threonylcarbamoyladenylate synthase
MKTEVLKVNPKEPEPEIIAQAAKVIREGGLVAFPTETVYGLGANALDEKAVARIFAAKERPTDDPIIVHLSSPAELPIVAAEVPPIAFKLAELFWPGPLTLILPKAKSIPDLVTAGLPTVGVRVPAHPVALALIKASGCPIAAPSANLFGRPSPTLPEHVVEDLYGRVELILDAGPTFIGVESTVLDITRPTPTILRPGGLPREDLEEILGRVEVKTGPMPGPKPSPGLMEKHYAPKASLYLVIGENGALRSFLREKAEEAVALGIKRGFIIAEEDRESLRELPVIVQVLGSLKDPATVARRLFSSLRIMDALGVEDIYARDFGQEGLALAVHNRLLRASGGKVVILGGN